MANEVAKKANASLALFGDDAKGFDNMTQDDLALPFVRILGQLSPQVTMGDAKYIESAKPGMTIILLPANFTMVKKVSR